MNLTEPIAHGEAVRGLWRAAAAGRLGHALMFTGTPGTGRFMSASWFAAGLLCDGGPLRTGSMSDAWSPCGTCPACKKLQAGEAGGNHPDLLCIDPVAEGASEIVVSRIALRSGDSKDERVPMAAFLGLKASEGGARVVLIRETERMNESAQNALLKTLEEPAPNTYLILECGQPSRLLPTIRSRVLEVRCRSLTLDETRWAASRALEGVEGIALEELERFSILGGNSPGRGLELMRRGAPALLRVLEDLRAGRLDPASAADQIWQVEGKFPGERPLQRERERVRTVLDLALAEAERSLLAGLPASSGPAAPGGPLVDPVVARPGAGARAAGLMALSQDLGRNLDPSGVLVRALALVGAG